MGFDMFNTKLIDCELEIPENALGQLRKSAEENNTSIENIISLLIRVEAERDFKGVDTYFNGD